MAGFLYFIPGARNIPPLPPASDLQTILAGGSLSWCNVEGIGPDGSNGAVCAINGPHAPRVGYYPKSQTWEKIENSEGTVTHWLGWENDSLPGPSDLLRAKPPEGHLVELGDGNLWRIPAVRAYIPEAVTLPQRMKLSSKGELSYEPVPGYSALVEESAFWWDIFSNGGSYEFKRYWKYACMLLGVCYHVGRPEVNALGLLHKTVGQIESVIYSSIGFPDIVAQREAQKKMDGAQPADISDSSVGVEG